MSTTRELVVGTENVIRTPSKQAIRKKIGKSHTLPGFQIKPGYLYTVVRAISARVNQNFDGWPSNELREAAHTFVGKPVFVNHENYDPNEARGVVVAARYIENGRDKYIEVVQEIDAVSFPKLAHEIKTGGLDSVSMGAEAGFTICSACGNKAQDMEDMCYHVLFKKGETVNVRNKKTGKVEQKLVYESCHKLSFFELSYVFDPADETAVASKVIVGKRQHQHVAGQCGPGDTDCAATFPDPRGLPETAYPSGGGGGAAAGTPAVDTSAIEGQPGGGGSPGADGIMDSSRGLYDTIKQYHDGEIGGYREDSYGEHANGALDVMTSDPATVERVKADAFAAGSPYVLWNQTQWNADGTSSPMEDRGDPTQNHMDHVHTAPIGNKAARKAFIAKIAEYVPENSQKTQRPGTLPTYTKAHAFFDQLGAPHDKGTAGVLDYGAGLGHSGKWGHTYEPHPQTGFEPTYTKAEDVPEGAYHRVTNLNVLNVVPPEIRHQIVDGIGRSLAPGGHAIITTRGLKEVQQAKNAVPADNGDFGAVRVRPDTPHETYQKGFTPKELHQYVSERLGPEYTVKPLKLGPAGVHVVRNGGDQLMTAFKQEVRAHIMKKAWGEIEAPQAVDTLREEGSAPEDDNDDFHHYVDSPQELSMPDLSQANQLDREQAAGEAQAGPMNPEAMGNPNGGGIPGPAEGGPPPGAQPPGGGQQYMTLQIPIPGSGAAPGGTPPPAVPMQSFAGKGAVSGRTLAWMERYFGHRVANWQDAIVAGRDLTPEEKADFNREAALWTLENRVAESGSSRNTTRGTANMARSTLASRRKTAGTRHFAEGPLVDTGDQSRNDQGEQEEAFITETPPEVSDTLPDDDTSNISNTEGNLVADAEYARSLTSKLAQQRAALEATAREYARVAGRKFTADEYAGGPVATEVDPTVQTEAGEKLTGDDFDSAATPEPGIDTSPAGPGTTTLPIESSLKAFQTFDRWLTASTGKSSREHSEKNIKRAAQQFAAYNKIKVAALYPALGIVLRQARKVEAEKKGQPVRKKAVDLETAAPDERVSVPAPVSNTTDAEAQASQYDEEGFGNNAGDDISEYDGSTGQNFAPGQAPNKSAKKADGILAIRCAEAMIAAGLEPNTRERKYQLAAQFEKMSRGLIMDRTALAERFAMVRQADNQRYAQKVASGRTRGTASPVPPGMGHGGGGNTAPRTASRRVAANDPVNDSLMFG
ncbi:hypothetical protein MYRNA_97 [Mycobacterium phage Myrna]|uniref:ARB-07466-like C-terminal domain-containing protein n=1 Tax=Mycobacterium phage Myrna TaxID=546805 RepID=B5LJA1_9CAUD|nr:gp97 [Mycobacterium phage Myrna]ACH62098.1 hypothetical protein MYRNA_97 [Mycobacterium phage Myrna]